MLFCGGCLLLCLPKAHGILGGVRETLRFWSEVGRGVEDAVFSRVEGREEEIWNLFKWDGDS